MLWLCHGTDVGCAKAEGHSDSTHLPWGILAAKIICRNAAISGFQAVQSLVLLWELVGWGGGNGCNSRKRFMSRFFAMSRFPEELSCFCF